MTNMGTLGDLEWDYADRLRHVDKVGGGDVYFTYDAGGQRVRKVWEHSSLVEERIYLGGFEIYRKWDGPIGDVGTTLELERETLHINDGQRRIAMVETKTVDPSGTGTGPLLTSRWRFQLTNHLDSASMELDHEAGVISYEEFHPYGSTAFHTAKAGAEVSAKRYRYTGKERDEETGLYYHGARYYAAWLGRWTAPDPLGVAQPGKPDLNLYAYVSGRVTSLNDPSGFDPKIRDGSSYSVRDTADGYQYDFSLDPANVSGDPPPVGGATAESEILPLDDEPIAPSPAGLQGATREERWEAAKEGFIDFLVWDVGTLGVVPLIDMMLPHPVPEPLPFDMREYELEQSYEFARGGANFLTMAFSLKSAAGAADNLVGGEWRLLRGPSEAVPMILEPLPAPKVLKAPDESYTDLFRALKPDELLDIQTSGEFRSVEGLEGKYFTTSAEEASNYARMAVKGFKDPPYTIVRTRAPSRFLEIPNISATVDRGIPAFVLPNDVLPGLQPYILKYSPVLRMPR